MDLSRVCRIWPDEDSAKLTRCSWDELAFVFQQMGTDAVLCVCVDRCYFELTAVRLSSHEVIVVSAEDAVAAYPPLWIAWGEEVTVWDKYIAYRGMAERLAWYLSYFILDRDYDGPDEWLEWSLDHPDEHKSRDEKARMIVKILLSRQPSFALYRAPMLPQGAADGEGPRFD